MERATVHKTGAKRAKSNKYSKSDSSERPAKGTASRVWVAGYTRKDGTKIEGHYRVTK